MTIKDPLFTSEDVVMLRSGDPGDSVSMTDLDRRAELADRLQQWIDQQAPKPRRLVRCVLGDGWASWQVSDTGEIWTEARREKVVGRTFTAWRREFLDDDITVIGDLAETDSDVGRIQMAMIRMGFIDEVVNPKPLGQWLDSEEPPRDAAQQA